MHTTQRGRPVVRGRVRACLRRLLRQDAAVLGHRIVADVRVHSGRRLAQPLVVGGVRLVELRTVLANPQPPVQALRVRRGGRLLRQLHVAAHVDLVHTAGALELQALFRLSQQMVVGALEAHDRARLLQAARARLPRAVARRECLLLA